MLQRISQIIAEPSFLKGVLVALLLAIVTKIGYWLIDVVLQAWRSRQAFDISGNWIGDCLLPSYQQRELEIWHYARKGDLMKLSFFAYGLNDPKPRRWIGGGVYRGSKLSAYYYRLAGETYESGVVALELRALQLEGVYAQFDPKVKGEPLYVSQQGYAQTRIKLAFFPRMKMLFGFPPFRTYAEVEKLYDAGGKSRSAAP
jgi:hypothetical protein